MPIYEYCCSACGARKEALQKLSDAPLVNCTECGQATLTKLLSAPGFQLKGSGWYATDFKNSGSKKPETTTDTKTESSTTSSEQTSSGGHGCSGSCACAPSS